MRVRTDAKREAILDIAAQAFMELGYERTSMAEIAARVGGSKATLYGYFPSKEELFMAMVQHKLGREFEPAIKDLPSQGKEDPRTLLTHLGERYIEAIVTPEAAALKRLIFSQTTQPAAIEKFWEDGPQQMINTIKTYLEAATMAGRLNVKDAKVAAQHLLSLYESELAWRGPLDKDRTVTRDQINDMVARAVGVFLAAYG
jgi:AcrR family transcriptional regulator